MKILTIGNSFADNATVYLHDMAASSNIELIIGKMNPGGCSLKKHCNLAEQSDILPDVKPYNFSLTGNEPRPAALKEVLSSFEWDFVTLQQVSDLSWREDTYFPYIQQLHDLVKSLAPQAQIVVHQTWAYRNDATEYEKYGINQKIMFYCLKEAYANAAKKLGCRILPSGEAFQKARAVYNYTRDTNYDFENPQPLQLPDQEKSLISGYYWGTGNTDSGKAELHIDGRHGNKKGCYLVNAVWYEMFTGESIYDNTYCPEGVSQEDLAILKKAAHEAVAENGGPLKK